MEEDIAPEGVWHTVLPTDAFHLFASSQTTWWIAGGWALDLYRCTQARPHQDLDVGVLRRDVSTLLHSISTWEVFEAKSGRLTRLAAGHTPRLDVHSLWCRPMAADSWTIEVMVDEADGDVWVYRRERRIRRPLSILIRHNSDGIPYLAPEIQLLYKSKTPREHGEQDFLKIRPLLAEDARRWLQNALELVRPDHPWISTLKKPQQV